VDTYEHGGLSVQKAGTSAVDPQVIALPDYTRLKSMSEEELIQKYNAAQIFYLSEKYHHLGNLSNFWLDEIIRRGNAKEAKWSGRLAVVALIVSLVAVGLQVVDLLKPTP